jgi:hypothetical protein
MLGFFWPSKLQSNPTGAARTGRVIHWIFVLLGLMTFALGTTFALAGERQPWLAVLLGLIYATPIVLGCGIRYILSSE